MINRKKNNKGFSLIELIIVIAIMAVLTAILAPQLLRYVERSREARDRQNIQAVYEAFQIAITEETTSINPGIIYYRPSGELQGMGETLRNEFVLTFGAGGLNGTKYFVKPLVSAKFKQAANNPQFYFEWNGGNSVKDYIIVTYKNPVA